MAWLGDRELLTLVLLALVTAGVWGFAELADEVVEGSTRVLDTQLLLTLRNPENSAEPLGPAWLEEMGRDFTALGGVGVLTLLTLAALSYLLLLGKPKLMLFVLVAVGGGLLLSTLLKLGFDRPRPELVPHGSYVYTASFPSGHSMLAATVYLTLGALLVRAQPRRRLKAFILASSILVTLLVGVSRVYLGVHWPTDVLAGWALGATWALLCWLVAHALQNRGHVEQQEPEPPPPG